MEHSVFSNLKLVFIACLGGFIGACLLFLILKTTHQLSPDPSVQAKVYATSQTPGLDYMDDYRCPRGENKIILVNGVEDGYARGNAEPARPHERLMHSPYFQDHVNDTVTPMSARNYDERGTDKRLFDHFTVPPSITRSELVFRMKPAGSITTDTVYLADYLGAMNDQANKLDYEYIFPDPFASGTKHIHQVGPTGDAIYKLPLKEFLNPGDPEKSKSFIHYIENSISDTVVDLMIQDDGIVDFSGLVLCQKPAIQRGTTFGEFADPTYVPNLSFLQCSNDLTQKQCDSFAGDHVCTTELPLACYKEGNQLPPQYLIDQKQTANYVGGEVKVTAPVSGDQFDEIDDANGYCQSNFGNDWRVLSYHESGGAVVVSHSKIEPRTRVWVDVKTNSYANCWDRKNEGQP